MTLMDKKKGVAWQQFFAKQKFCDAAKIIMQIYENLVTPKFPSIWYNFSYLFGIF